MPRNSPSVLALLSALMLAAGCAGTLPPASTPLGPLDEAHAVQAPAPFADGFTRWDRRWTLTPAGLAQGWSLLDREAEKQIGAADPALGEALRRFKDQRGDEALLALPFVFTSTPMAGSAAAMGASGALFDQDIEAELLAANARGGLPGLRNGALASLARLAADPRFEASKGRILPWYSVREGGSRKAGRIGPMEASDEAIALHLQGLGFGAEAARYRTASRIGTVGDWMAIVGAVAGSGAVGYFLSSSDKQTLDAAKPFILGGLAVGVIGMGLSLTGDGLRVAPVRDFNRGLAARHSLPMPEQP